MDELVPDISQVAIITGATSGIGLWLAERLHGRGYHVALCGRRVQEGTDAASRLDPSGDSAIFVQCDVTSYASQAAMFQAVWAKWSRLDVLVANAGGLDQDSKYILRHRDAGVHTLPPEPDTVCTDIDFKGLIYGTTLATHFMRYNAKGKGGKIIVTGSMLGIYACATFPEYCAAKAAAHHYVRTVAPVLLQKENITINCVMPGPIDTNVVVGISDAFAPEHLTLKPVLLSAYDHFLEDKDNIVTGQLIGAAHKNLIFWPHPGYKEGAILKRYEKTFDPWFRMVHGESSELSDAIYEPVGFRGPKILAVTGATGSQGGGIVNIMRSVPGWKVRALTRNPSSDAARRLTEDGVEVVKADFDDKDSLRKAFMGVNAIFAVTNWWEHLFQGKSQDKAGEIEEEQGMKLARAAAATPTLEHYIWSTAPSAKRKLNGRILTPHMDYKANVDARIKAELPDLAAITTYLYFGYYPQNMAFFPLIKPIQYPGNGRFIQTLPTKPEAAVLSSGDMTVNPGIWVRQVLATGAKAFGMYANVALERLTFQEMMDIWSEVTGYKGVLIETTIDAWTKLWGPAGNELGLQFKFGELCDPWEVDEAFISPEELSIDPNEVVGFRGTIEGLKHLF